MNEELKTYWQYLRDNNADVPDTFESFHKTLQDDISAKKYYDYLKEQGFDAPETFESFSNTLGLKKKESTGGFTTPSPILDQEPQLGSKDFLNQITYKPEEPAIGTIPVTPLDPSEQRAETFLANENLKEQLEQGRKEYESQKNAPQRSDFGMMNLDEIDAELAKKAPPVFNQPSVEPGSTDIQSQLKVPVSQIDLDVNKFESKKDNIRDLKVKADKAAYADELQKFSETAISKIDKELAKMPSNISFEDTGMGGVSVPQKDEKQQILEMAREILQEVKDSPDKGGFWEGFGSKGFVGMLPFVSGLEELPKLKKIRDVSLEAQPGDKENELRAFMGEEQVDNLAPEKRQLLSAAAIRQEFERAKEQPGMYRFGRVLAEMAPYMGEYVATAGVYSAGRKAVTTGLEMALKGAAKKSIIRNGVIKPISTLAGISLQTAANPTRIASTTMERMTPQLKTTLSLTPDEIKGVVGEDGEKFTEAFAKAFGVNAMELLTERFGQWSSEAGDAIKAAGYWLPNVTLGRWMAKRGLVNLEEANKAAKALGWDGIFKEIWVEEYPNKLLQEAITGDQNILTELNKPGPPSNETLEFFNPLSEEFLDMILPSLIIGGGPMAYGGFKKWATSGAPTVKEQIAKGPAGDIKDVEKLTEKLKSSEKPKEPTRPVAAAEVPKVETQESVPVQGEPEVKGEEVTGYKAGDTVELSPKKEGVTEVDEFVSKVKSGEQMNSPEDIQFYENNKKEIEVKLKSDIAKQKIENPEIDETEIATREDAADEDTVIKQGEDVIRKATAVTNEEEAELSLDEIERTLTATEKKIKGLRDKYDTSDIPHEYPNKVVGKEAKKDIRKYVGVVSKYTGWEPTKLHDNIAPAGGEVSFTLAIPNTPYEMYAQVKYDPDYNNGYENYKPVEIFYRIENPNEKGQKKYAGPNQLIVLDDSNRGWPGSRKFSGAAKFSPKDLAQIFIEEAKKFTGKKEATDIATKEGFDSPSHLINSVKKRTGEEYENVQDIPKDVIEETVKSREEEKPKITQIKEANPERILVVKPTSDTRLKEVSKDKYQADSDKILVTVTRSQKPGALGGMPFWDVAVVNKENGKATGYQWDSKEKALEFAEDAIKAKDKPRKSDAKFEKARKSAAELLDLIGPGLKLDEQFDSQRNQKIIIKAGEVVADYIDAGVTRFAEMVQDIIETMGEQAARVLFEPMKKGYGSQMASVPDDVADKMDDLKTVRAAKIEDILKPQTDEQTGTTANQPGGGAGSGIAGDNETQSQGGTEQGNLEGSEGTDGEVSENGSGVEGNLPEPGDVTSGSPQGSNEGRIRPELADADVQHNFVYPENWERNKNKTFSKKQAYKDNIAALEVINELLDNPELFATDEQKQILSRYNGLGPLGEILLPADKKRWNQTQLEHAELSDRLKELLKQIGEKTKSDPLATAESSTQNAFYTSLPIIRAIWKGIQAGGFNGGKILEGSVGSGRFIGGMPPHIMDGSRIKGVDMDIVSGLITHYLYPKISVVNSPIQEASLPSNYYDLFVSNIPFGTNHVYDPLFKERGGLWAKSMEALHSYFFAKAIDTVRPGGYVAIVTSSAILDTPANQYIRDLINNETEFIGAVRLSEDAFNSDAGTSVITDVILLRKKLEPSKSDSQISSLTRKKVKHKYENESDQEIRYNEYFEKNPDHVFGDEWLAGGLYSRDSGYTIKGKFNPEDVGTKLAELAAKLPILPKVVPADFEQDNTLQISPLGRMVSGGIVEKEGDYYTVLDYDKYTQKYTVEKIKNPAAKDIPILKSFVDIKNNFFSILSNDTQGQDATEERKKLKKQLNEFVKLIKPKSITTFGDGAKAIERLLVKDPDFYAVTSLINEDGTFSDVVTNPIKTEKQEFTETTNAQEAIGYSINTFGKINVPFIQKVMGAETEQEAIDLMQDEIFETPDEVVEKSIYLSGNVAEKLKQAKEWLKTDKKYEKNVKALTEVLPPPLTKDQITFQLGASWIPLVYTQQFLDSVFGEGLVSVRHEKITDNYEVITDIKGGDYEASDDSGNIKDPAFVIKAALTKSVPMITKTEGKETYQLPQLTQSVRDKADRLQDEFAGLVDADQKMGEELSDMYNELFNGIVNKQADGSKLTFPGWSHPIYKLLPHQKDAIMLMIQRMGGMIDHIVGGGKSFIMGAAGIKMKQLGLINKPIITTMKSVVPGMVKDIKAAYPSARILAPNEGDFTAGKRQRLFAKIANNDWDLIIITHENLNKIPLPDEFQKKHIGNEIEELRNALEDLRSDVTGKDQWLVKQAKAVQKRIDNLVAELKSIQDKGKHGSRTDFGTMGIDMLFVDESQQFKNLAYITKLRGVAGLGNPEGSGRAANLKMVARYLQDLHGGDKGVAFASGTPISNSLVEVYGIFQYLRPSLLKKLNMNSLDQFLKTFAKIETLMEANMAGVIKMKTRLSGFVNVADLASLYTEIADIRGVHNLKIERPDIKGGGPRMVTVPQSETVKRLSDAIRESSSTGSLGPLNKLGVTFKGDAEKSIGLVLTTFGTKISSDPRLAFPKMQADGGKLFTVADEVKAIYDKTSDIKGTQLVFADMGVPKDKKASIGIRVRDQITEMHGPEIFNEISGLSSITNLKDENEIKQKLMELMEIDINQANEIITEANDVNSFSIYGALKEVLIERGIPEKEIAFIHDAKNNKQKDDLFDNFKKGNVRVLIGSTEKMGTGVNVQTRVVAMHHIDIKWRPSDLEQRNGRGIRRGNMNKEVEIIYYGTDKMPIDSYRFSLNGKKQKDIDTFRSGAIGIREMSFEDGESMTLSEFSAKLSGDDRIVKLERLKDKVNKLRNRVNSVHRSNALREKRIRDAKRAIEVTTEKIKAGARIVDYVKSVISIKEIEEEIIDVEASKKKGDEVLKKTKADVAVFTGTVDGESYDTSTMAQRKKFYEALKDNIGYLIGGRKDKIGSIGNLDIYAQKTYDTKSKEDFTRIWVELKGDTGFPLDIIQNSSKPDALRIRIGMLNLVRGIDNTNAHDKWYLGHTTKELKDIEAVPEAKAKEKDVEELNEAEYNLELLDAELRAEAKENETPKTKVEKEGEEEETPNKPLSDMIKDISDLGAGQFKDIDGMAMTSFIPGLKPKGKVRVKPNNNKLIAHVVSKNAQATPEQQLQEAIQFNDPEVQKRFDESRVWTLPNMESFFDTIKDWAKGFSQHFKYLNAKAFPREANILREFETLNKWAKGEATRYMRGLVSTLTPEQFAIFSNRIILADMLGSIKRGENMTGPDGKYPFGLSSVQEIESELAKFEELMRAEPIIERANDARNAFMDAFKQELIASGLLEENEIDDYYHRRVLEYQHDSLNENILFGKTIGDKKRSFQKRRTGTRGMDYNTNFIETEFKVVSEGLFELEKQKILKDLMAPYEVQLKELEKQFKAEFDKKMKELEDQYGPDSEEVKIHNDSKRALKRNYLNENIPDGYVFWRVSEENRLFWGKTVTQKVIDNALQAAADNDQSGMSDAMKVVDDLVGSMQMGLMVGSKRKQYMVPRELAQQLEEMAKDKEIPISIKFVTNLTTLWKRHTLLFPTRIIRYNLNNMGGDIDRALQVEPAILKYGKESFRELYDYYTTGKTTDQLLEAMRGDVISSGFQISELADLKNMDWVRWVDSKGGDLTVEKVMGKEWVKANAIALGSKPADLYNKYMDAASQVVEFREAILRYAAYKLAVDKTKKGQKFYWASDPKQIDNIPNDRQRNAKLSREVFGDYVNISITGQELRRTAMPFYSWTEINMKTHWQLIKNASSPEAQRKMIAIGLAKGIPVIAVKMAWAYTKLALFSAAIQAWNYAMFGGDDDDDSPMGKLRRSTIKGLQVIVDVDPETGFIKTLPIQGTFYDFLDFMGIPSGYTEAKDIIEEKKPVTAERLLDVPGTMYNQATNRVWQMITPFVKMPIELGNEQKYFPDRKNPIPIRDPWEYIAETIALKDEYNYIFSDAPKKEGYWKRKWNNSLFLREFDTELLAYYATKKIIREYKGGATGYETGQNKVEQDKSKAAYYYALSKRYGNTEDANKYLNQWIALEGLAIGKEFTSTGAGTAAALGKLFLGTGNNPAKDLNVLETNDLVKLFADPEYKPMTAFGKSLTPREIAIMKDGTRFYNRISGFEGPNALFIKK